MRHSLRIKRLIVALAIFLLVGCDSSNDSDFVFTGTGAGPPQFPVVTLQEDLFGRVYLSQLAADVTVEALRADGDVVLFSVEADGSGEFRIPAGTRLPSNFRLAAVAPEGLRVERYVDLSQRESDEHLWINVPTSLISVYKQLHPEESLPDIEARLKAVLGIAESDSFYGWSDRPGTPFSHKLFVERANAAGGVSAYIRDVVAILENGGTISFAPESLAVGRDSIGANAAVNAQFAELADDAAGFLLSQTASECFDYATGSTVNEFGKLTGLSGLNLGKVAKYNEVISTLTDIETDITDLEATVNSDFLTTLETIDNNAFHTYLTSVQTAYDLLVTNSNAFVTTTNNNGEQDVFDHGPATSEGARSTAMSNYTAAVGDNAISALNTYLNNSGNYNLNLLALAAQSVSGNLLTSPASNSVVADYAFYPYRRDVYSEQLWNNFLLYQGYGVPIATLISENGNATYLPQDIVESGQTGGSTYSAPAPALNDALAQVAQIYEILSSAKKRSVPEPVYTDLVLIDAKNRKMWYLSTYLSTYDQAQNKVRSLSLLNWKYPSGYVDSTSGLDVCPSTPDDFHDFNRPNNLKGFRLPQSSELATLRGILAEINPNAPGDANNTYDALVDFGFTGLKSPSEDNDDNYKKYWCNDKPPEDEGALGTGTTYHYYDMKDGDLKQEDRADGSISPDDGSPLWTAIYVRDIARFDQYPGFGDNVNQIVRCYGEPPDSIYILEADNQTTTNGETVSVITLQVNGRMTNNYNPQSNITDLVSWSFQNSSGSDNTTPPAYIRYRPVTGTDINGNTQNQTFVDLVTTRQDEIWTVTATYDNAKKATYTVGTGAVPQVTGIAVTPQNMNLQGIPTENSSFQFYCTGYLATGQTVDLTKSVTWSLETTIEGGTTPTGFAANDPGLLLFGDDLGEVPEITVKATYNGQGDNNSRSAYGQTFSQTAVFGVPERQTTNN